MTTTITKTSAARGRLWGAVDGSIGKLCGARERFMRERHQLSEVGWPAFRDAYDKATAEASPFTRGGRS